MAKVSGHYQPRFYSGALFFIIATKLSMSKNVLATFYKFVDKELADTRFVLDRHLLYGEWSSVWGAFDTDKVLSQITFWHDSSCVREVYSLVLDKYIIEARIIPLADFADMQQVFAGFCQTVTALDEE